MSDFGGGDHGGSSSDGGHGGSSGHDHDNLGSAFQGGAFASSGCGTGSGFSYGSLAHALAFMGHTEGCEDGARRGGRRVRLPGLASSERSAQVLAWPHGCCDAETAARAIMGKHGFLNTAYKKWDTAPSAKIENELRDTTPFDGHMFNSAMPSGWYDGASGYTRSFRTYWQLPVRKGWWSHLEVDPDEPVHVVLSGATWFYNEMGDFESRILLYVASRAKLKHGLWLHRHDLIQKHLVAAKSVAADMFAYLKGCQPSESSLVHRRVQVEADVAAQKAHELLTRERIQPGQRPAPTWPRTKVVRVVDTNQPDPLNFDESEAHASQPPSK